MYRSPLGAVANPRLAFAGDPDSGALVDSGGDFDGQVAAAQRAAFALAGGAGVGDGLAAAAA